MSTITLVTGNPNKLKELKALAPNYIDFASKEVDLAEIQSLDIHEIVEDKVKRAYEIVKGPVIVEDVSAGLDDLGGLPGPFYKFFREKLGDVILVKLSTIAKSNKVTVQCLAAYYDGKILLFGHGVLKGTAVDPRGENGFGFDPVIVPNGQSRTMAEMSAEEKNKISHRGLAFRDLLNQIETLK